MRVLDGLCLAWIESVWCGSVYGYAARHAFNITYNLCLPAVLHGDVSQCVCIRCGCCLKKDNGVALPHFDASSAEHVSIELVSSSE